ncbi:MAG: hypothetical protein OXB99_09460, partial [Acidimicrobiaceae bacterium]|nr:hypothetical protein [Acidimicrobiaceae bacterium]
MADGEVTPDEAVFLVVIAQDFLPYPYCLDDLTEDIAAFSDEDVLATMGSMRQLSGTLSNHGRELALIIHENAASRVLGIPVGLICRFGVLGLQAAASWGCRWSRFRCSCG